MSAEAPAATEKPAEEVKVGDWHLSNVGCLSEALLSSVHACFCPFLLFSQPAPVFGAAFSAGAGGGFAGFTGVTSTPAPAADAGAAAAADGEEDDGAAAEEECQAEYKPVVQLEEVETSTGEEDEETLTEL